MPPAKYVHEVLVNRLGGLSLPRKSVVRLTDRPDMTLDVYRGRKTTIQQLSKLFLAPSKTHTQIFIMSTTSMQGFKAKWSKYPNHKSELVRQFNIDNSEIFDTQTSIETGFVVYTYPCNCMVYRLAQMSVFLVALK